MVKIAEEALGGQYTITVNPYPSTTGAMKATMDGDGEIGYTADVGMTQILCREAGSRTTRRRRGSWCTPVFLPDGVVHGRLGQGRRQVQVLGRLQRQSRCSLPPPAS